ncbi:MAG: orotate phosphoribosyltransferase [Firmicutes bacterium]|nr:orotate phosphoribosyltransferase [Bacillota bacterium]MBV1727388.1 orotate phosphoribosyltransferase [Desulforudis sp.]MBU4532862.1 orotate phosphoribosyltransferase [Bacillota bacterium]MBU4555132.1 orotate phosphoribosyltransferase [Bacillota bacterium]MBV1734386.1 orotate phosphoribosyltransferase [Desulforudis sp.]
MLYSKKVAVSFYRHWRLIILSLSPKQVESILVECKALLEGHFLLTSGRHSGRYVQCAQVLQYPEHCAKLGAAIADGFRDAEVDLVVGPALGGILIAYEVARALGTKCLFAERENGKMALRRGFVIAPGTKVLVVEDVITTGGSVREVMDLVMASGAEVVGVGVLVNRSGGKADFGVPLHALLSLSIEAYDPADCPLCAAGTPAVKPGSRSITGTA